MKYLLFFLLLPLLSLSQSNTAQVTLLFQQKAFEKAEFVLKDVLEKTPEDIEALELMGDALGHQKRWDEALVYYKKLVDRKPKEANYHYKYGGVLGMKALENKFKAIGLIGDIKTAFTTAATLDKTHIPARWALVEFYMQLPGIFGGSQSKSEFYAEELEQLSKVDGYLAKGYIYEYDNEPELAEKYYKKAIEEGGSLTCFGKLTTLYEKQGTPAKAIENIEAAQQKHQRNALHYQIGKVAAEYNIQLGKGEKCLLTYLDNYSAEDGVPKAWAYYRLAQINVHKNEKTDALRYIDMALNELPKRKPFNDLKAQILKL
jgi:tetratricopeptide (TPR) repeat protein